MAAPGIPWCWPATTDCLAPGTAAAIAAADRPAHGALDPPASASVGTSMRASRSTGGRPPLPRRTSYTSVGASPRIRGQPGPVRIISTTSGGVPTARRKVAAAPSGSPAARQFRSCCRSSADPPLPSSWAVYGAS